jgi:hypothetical protein
MFGPAFYLFDIAFALFPLLPLILYLISYHLGFANRRRKRDDRTLVGWIAFAFIGFLWVPIVGTRLYYKTANYLFLSTLRASDVANITVGESSWTQQTDLQGIVAALNRPIWHVTNHDIGGPYETLTITLHSGQVKIFRVGRHDDREGALIEFFRPFASGNGFWADGDTFIPVLPRLLESLGHTLPIKP